MSWSGRISVGNRWILSAFWSLDTVFVRAKGIQTGEPVPGSRPSLLRGWCSGIPGGPMPSPQPFPKGAGSRSAEHPRGVPASPSLGCPELRRPAPFGRGWGEGIGPPGIPEHYPQRRLDRGPGTGSRIPAPPCAGRPGWARKASREMSVRPGRSRKASRKVAGRPGRSRKASRKVALRPGGARKASRKVAGRPGWARKASRELSVRRGRSRKASRKVALRPGGARKASRKVAGRPGWARKASRKLSVRRGRSRKASRKVALRRGGARKASREVALRRGGARKASRKVAGRPVRARKASREMPVRPEVPPPRWMVDGILGVRWGGPALPKRCRAP